MKSCFRKSKQGSTLIEVIVALVIIAIVGMAVMESFSTSSKTMRASKVIDSSTQVASNIIEEFKKNPSAFIDNKTTSSGTPSVSGSNTISNHTGIEYYNYKWEKVSSPVSNGYEVKYTAIEDKHVGEEQFRQINKFADTYKLKPNVNQYLFVLLDVPDYSNWATTLGDYYMLILPNWTYSDYENWVFTKGDSSWYKNIIQSNSGIGYYYDEEDYKTYVTQGDAVFEMMAINLLVSGFVHESSFNTIFTRPYMSNVIGNEAAGKVVKSDFPDGNAVLVLDETQFNLTSTTKCKIDVVNKSRDLNLDVYFKGSTTSIIDLIEKKVDMDVHSGIVKTTKETSDISMESSYSLNVDVYSSKTSEKIYNLSTDEYVAK